MRGSKRQGEREDESDRRRQPHHGSSHRSITRRPFIKCYPGCINLISTPSLLPMLLPGWEICYGWRFKDLSRESGWECGGGDNGETSGLHAKTSHAFMQQRVNASICILCMNKTIGIV